MQAFVSDAVAFAGFQMLFSAHNTPAKGLMHGHEAHHLIVSR